MELLKEGIKRFKEILNLHGNINDVSWSKLEIYFAVNSISKKGRLVDFGDIPQMIYFNLGGIFRSYFLNEQGKTYTKNLFLPDDLMGSMPALLRRQPSTLAIEALTSAKVLSIPFKILKDAMRSDLALQAIYISYIEEHWIVEQEEIERSIVMDNATERYLHLLDKEPEIDQLIPHYYIADHLGITPTQLSRIRKKTKSQPM